MIFTKNTGMKLDHTHFYENSQNFELKLDNLFYRTVLLNSSDIKSDENVCYVNKMCFLCKGFAT